MGNTLNTLTRRVEHLERSCRRWRVAASLTLAALCLFFIACATGIYVPKKVLAREFRLVDKNGVTIGTLAAGEGIASLTVSNRDKRTQASLVVGDEAAFLNFKVSGEDRMRLDALSQSGALTIFNRDGKKRIGMGITKKGEPYWTTVD